MPPHSCIRQWPLWEINNATEICSPCLLPAPQPSASATCQDTRGCCQWPAQPGDAATPVQSHQDLHAALQGTWAVSETKASFKPSKVNTHWSPTHLNGMWLPLGRVYQWKPFLSSTAAYQAINEWDSHRKHTGCIAVTQTTELIPRVWGLLRLPQGSMSFLLHPQQELAREVRSHSKHTEPLKSHKHDECFRNTSWPFQSFISPTRQCEWYSSRKLVRAGLAYLS